jgi:hypothetical protein
VLPPDGGPPGLVLSATKELEPGARAMLLLAEGLFRLDVRVSGDTLQTTVRNLSPGELEMGGSPRSDPGGGLAFGEAAIYEPGRSGLEFVLGSGGDRVTVSAVIATLRFAERGTVRVTTQAIVRGSVA